MGFIRLQVTGVSRQALGIFIVPPSKESPPKADRHLATVCGGTKAYRALYPIFSIDKMYIRSYNVVMNTITVSATHARNNFFSLLDQVAKGDTEVVIKKDTLEIATLSAKKKTKTDWEGLKKAMDAAAGILKDFELEKSPLRDPKLTSRLGKWDTPDYEVNK